MRYRTIGVGDVLPAARPRGGAARVRRGLLAAGLASCLTAAAAGAQTPEPSHEADGLVHASLALEAQGIDVAFPPELRAGHHAYQWLLSGTIGSRVKVGTLGAHRALRLGTLAPDIEAIEAEIAAIVAARQAEAEAGEEEEPDEDADESDEEMEPADPDLWLVRDAAGWQLEIHPTDGRDVRTVPLNHRETAVDSPTFAASLHATGAETGRLELRWGRHAWSADFRFEELPPTPRRARVSGRGTAREAEDSNEAIARGNMLAERNETAMVLPNGASIAMLYWKGIDVEDEDYPNVAAVQDGAVVEMIRSPGAAPEERRLAAIRQDRDPDREPRPGFRWRLRHLAAQGGRRLAVGVQPRAGLLGHAVRFRVRRSRNRGRLHAHGGIVPSARGRARADRPRPGAAGRALGPARVVRRLRRR